MANEDQLKVLRQGVEAWNDWRGENPDISVDFSRADLSGADLSEAKLFGTRLSWADLSEANLSGAVLNEANLYGAILSGADLFGSNLSEADLSRASLIEATLKMTKLTGCRVYGVSAWGLEIGDRNEQRDLIITPWDQPTVTVDDLEIAQFIYLLLHSDKMRRVIDTLTAKAVLIIGRFTPERKEVLDAIREELRKRGYVPILFDFEKPASRDLTETISTLAHMVRFIIADITDAKSIPAELERIVPDLPSVPVQPLIIDSDYEFSLFERIRRFQWVLEPYRYMDQAELIASLGEQVIAPAEMKVKECRQH